MVWFLSAQMQTELREPFTCPGSLLSSGETGDEQTVDKEVRALPRGAKETAGTRVEHPGPEGTAGDGAGQAGLPQGVTWEPKARGEKELAWLKHEGEHSRWRVRLCKGPGAAWSPAQCRSSKEPGMEREEGGREGMGGPCRALWAAGRTQALVPGREGESWRAKGRGGRTLVYICLHSKVFF